MAPRSSSNGPAVDPIELLSQKIAPAVKRKGSSIRLASNLVKAVKSELQTVRTLKKYVSDAIVVAIVSALDEHDKTCSRFDSAGFAVILQTLLQAKYSRQKERGIILLTASLHHDTHKTPPLKSIKVRKTAVGKESVLPLLSCFTNALENSRIRRWAGVLLLQLLEGCDPNRVVFEAGPEDSKRMLGTMVLEEQNEILRITCGQLLTALMGWGIPREDLWPVSTDLTHYENFPVSSQSEKHWNIAFQKYVDDIFDTSNASQSSGRLYFAQALMISPKGSLISGGIINILVDQDIFICTQSRDISFTESIEIPLQVIAGVILEDTPLEGVASSKASAIDVVVELKASSELSCYINSVPVDIRGLRMTVKDEVVANDLGRDIAGQKSTAKASQSQEMIVIADGFHDALCLKGDGVVEDSNKNPAKSDLDPDILRQLEEIQDGEQDVEFYNFIEESPQDPHIHQTESQGKHGVGGPPEDVGLIVEPRYGVDHYEADSRIHFQSSVPAGLSRHTESDKRASADKENDRDQNTNTDDRQSISTSRRKAHLRRSEPETRLPEPSSDQTSNEMSNLIGSPVVPFISPAQLKAKLMRSKAKLIPKAKRISKSKTIPKAKPKVAQPESHKEEIQKIKKYSLGPKPEAQILKAAATKEILAPKISVPKASLPKGGLRIPGPIPSSTPIAASSVVAKPTKTATSKALIPKKSAAKDNPERRNHPPRASLTELSTKSQDMQNSINSKANVAKILSLDAHGNLTQEGIAVNRRAARLSEALADLDDSNQHDASFGELTQTSLFYQPSHVTSRAGSLSPPPIAQCSPISLAKEDPPGMLIQGIQEIQEGMHVVSSKNNEAPWPHVSVQSESSPSSLERVSPVPLPAQEASPVERFIPEATILSSKNIAGLTGPRRSPRLVSQYSSREASVALSSIQAKARLVRKSVVTVQTNNNNPQHGIANWDNGTPLRAEKFLLFDDHLARKTPLISFGAKGPQNQGISKSNKYSLQRIKRVKQIEKPEICPLPTQTYTRKQLDKRKRDKENDPAVESNKRRQTSRLRRSKEGPSIARQESAVILSDAEDQTMSGHHTVAPKAAIFGSQGSRVNENGSPRGNNTSLDKQENYKALARKVLMYKKTTVMDGHNDRDAFLHYGGDEGLKIAGMNQEFHLDLPVTSSASFKVQPLSPCPNMEVTKLYLPYTKATNIEYRKVGKNVDHRKQDKLADPFLKESPERDLSSFARRLQYRGHTPIQKERETPTSHIPRNQRYKMGEDLEATLVNVEDDRHEEDYSSSSGVTSESSDEEQDRGARRVTAQTQQVQCDEWRMALKPHQRGILDILNQVSADLVRHLISHEQAVEDVLTEYEGGGTLLIKDLEKTHRDDRRRIQHELDKIKRIMIDEYREARLEISRINKAFRARPVRELEKEWMQEQDQMQRIIERGMKKSK